MLSEKKRVYFKKLLDGSLCLETGLSPYLGYKVTAQIVKEAIKKGKTLKKNR